MFYAQVPCFEQYTLSCNILCLGKDCLLVPIVLGTELSPQEAIYSHWRHWVLANQSCSSCFSLWISQVAPNTDTVGHFSWLSKREREFPLSGFIHSLSHSFIDSTNSSWGPGVYKAVATARNTSWPRQAKFLPSCSLHFVGEERWEAGNDLWHVVSAPNENTGASRRVVCKGCLKMNKKLIFWSLFQN